MELLEGDTTSVKVGTSPSHHIVRDIILEAAIANVEGLPKVFATRQTDIKLEHGDPFIESPDETFRYDISHSIGELADFKEKLFEDERLSQIYKLRHNFSDRFDNRSFIHPHGTTNFDYKAIAENRKEGFERFKCRARKENYIYLREHPEVRAMISLFIKKLLATQPPDPAQYLAEYFSARLGGLDFEAVLETELRKISRYRVTKMRAQGMINFVSTSSLPSDDTKELRRLESSVNFMKKLNIGPLAKDFYFDGYLPKRTVTLPPPTPPKKKKKKKCKICPDYCICVKGKGVRNPNYQAKSAKTDEICSEDGKNSKMCTKTEENLIVKPPSEGEEEDEEEEGGSEGEESIKGEASAGPEGTIVGEEYEEHPQLVDEGPPTLVDEGHPQAVEEKEHPQKERRVLFN